MSLLGLLAYSAALLCISAAATVPVVWYAPFLSGSGYGSEAIAFVFGLLKSTGGDTGAGIDLEFSIQQHGDSFNSDFVAGLGKEDRLMLQRLLYSSPPDMEEAIVICHSEPGAWNVETGPRYPTTLCPPPSPGPLASIGRTMFETDRLPSGWPVRLNALDHVWVPTDFHHRIFLAAGVREEKLAVIPEPVDTDFFHPDTRTDFALPTDAQPVIGRRREGGKPFRFLSVFKFEERKGWKFLLEAYLREFHRAANSAEDAVELWILTAPYHAGSDFDPARIIRRFAEEELGQDAAMLPPVLLVPTGVPARDMPGLYQSCDCFVLSSRGEGWGRPHVEAMSTGLPIIATRWSGPEEFMTEANSYPLRIDGMDEIKEGAFRGHKWSRPSVAHLRELMRHVVDHPEEARQRGEQARRDMVEKYSLAAVARIVKEELARVAQAARERRGKRQDRTEL